jgi:hypothetical protein
MRSASTNKRTGEVTTKTVPVKTMSVNKLAWTDDAHTLSTGLKMEAIYADHSNAMKTLANQARKEYVSVKSAPYSPSARKAYDPEVKSLSAKLTEAIRNRPLERQAQLIANTQFDLRKAANPNMEPAEIKKIKSQLLVEARRRMNAGKTLIDISDPEWKPSRLVRLATTGSRTS